ncbi:hypothetical protein ACTHQ4_17595 [Alkalicoccobacillus gibsonii]|uniref:hypothetical protein n=1 Tax=Alkalicoccobacillus gibsonii TaxID=79881 RepID=UPI003F7BB418
MKPSIHLIQMFILGTLLVGCSQESELTIKEAELIDNEELLFDSIGKETYLFDLEGELIKGKAMSIGVEEYDYGELKDDRIFLSLGKNADDEEAQVEKYKKLFIMLNENTDAEMSVDVRVTSENGFFSLTAAELGTIDVEEKAYASDEIIGEEAVNLMDDNGEDKRTYIAHLAISPDGTLRSFDIEHATQSNDDYKFLYLFYVETHDFEE